ncbi:MULTISPECIES: hypothetical protein [Cyanophyceae]|uniref:hypothetical protein n=1 Tax=Cyanophyceae TaxID=3028117 RepID=UPI00016DCA75|nr:MULTISPECIES: hypothetical protein [Cyanophyceae]ACA99938.1 conserved hypothetical protein [Picosynechococcus sp. PCC 7002]ANV90942.1 hypothetical protein AWQ24_10015 [Picosynechococcus sp. PCC 8807]QCS50458.1 hypothetical protein FEK30_14075 [Picosynechococcus sp. PCC 11901]SMH54716.1 hypothetical protein SAMN06272755_2842 [Picosynechococcus sp. OG1]SMQ83017.1 hypothetical protein SAMN06272774_2118 [Synechococcus sp. 7002]
MSASIVELMDQLPEKNLTTMLLNGLDFVVPGEWTNIVGFDNMVKAVTRETDPAIIQAVRDRAIVLYSDKSQGYQRAMWIYQTVDQADKALAAAALANKVGDKIPLVGGLMQKVTPNADKAQAIDLCLKLVAEITCFCQINGIPGDSLGDFMKAIADYSGEELMRIATLICVDGLIPLGPDFLQKIDRTLNNLSAGELSNNPAFGRVGEFLPGGNPAGKLAFINRSFSSMQGWMSGFVSARGLTPEKIMDHIQGFVEVSDNKLDYVAAFLDLSTNYYEHTGTQTVARRLIDRAYGEI